MWEEYQNDLATLAYETKGFAMKITTQEYSAIKTRMECKSSRRMKSMIIIMTILFVITAYFTSKTCNGRIVCRDSTSRYLILNQERLQV